MTNIGVTISSGIIWNPVGWPIKNGKHYADPAITTVIALLIIWNSTKMCVNIGGVVKDLIQHLKDARDEGKDIAEFVRDDERMDLNLWECKKNLEKVSILNVIT
jgi:hypothetical protein